MNVDEINKYSFSLHDHKNHELDIALLSLKIGIMAYLSTYSKVHRFFDFIAEKEEDIQYVRKRLRESGYIQDYVETIFHFFLFIEISVKEILRNKHELLVSLGGNHHEILYKLLFQEENVSPDEIENLQSISFADAQQRLIKLIKKGKFENSKDMKIIIEKGKKDKGLDTLRIIRNRLIHRGTLVLDYRGLDKVIGEDLLPITIELLNLPIYKHHEFRWQPKDLHCKIDPLKEIINECKTSEPNIRKIAIYKQLALAAYANPIEAPMSALPFKGPTIKEEAEERAKKERDDWSDRPVDKEIKICPVCGAKALVRYMETRGEYNTLSYVDAIHCFCCDLYLDSDNLQDASISINGLNAKRFWQIS